MNQLSKLELGTRIAQMRKAKGISQEALASKIQISRPSLVQIENGNRSLDVFEMKSIASILGFSIDELLSANHLELAESEAIYLVKAKPNKKRNPIAKFNYEKFKNSFIYLLEKTAGKPNINEQTLLSLMYFSDFNYYELYESHLSTSQYKKRLNIPQPENINTIINQLIKENAIIRITTINNLNNKNQLSRLIPLVKSNLEILKASEKEIIDNVVELMSNWSNNRIYNYIQNDMPNTATKEGHTINFELAFYRETPYCIRSYNED